MNSNKLKYHVNLHKSGAIGRYTALKSANGKQVTWNLGDIGSRTYKIDLETNQESGLITSKVKGKGTIKQ